MSSDGWRGEIARDESGRASALYFTRIPSETVAAGSSKCRRPSCTKSVPPQEKRRGESKLYCSDGCRWKHWDEQHPRVAAPAVQTPLDFAPQVSDPRIPADEQPKLRTDVELVLARLEQGPATTAQLAEAAPRSLAIHSRVADVRAMLAPDRTVVKRRLGPRLYEYEIVRVANMPSTEGR